LWSSYRKLQESNSKNPRFFVDSVGNRKERKIVVSEKNISTAGKLLPQQYFFQRIKLKEKIFEMAAFLNVSGDGKLRLVKHIRSPNTQDPSELLLFRRS